MRNPVLNRNFFDSEDAVIDHVRRTGLERPAPVRTVVRPFFFFATVWSRFGSCTRFCVHQPPLCAHKLDESTFFVLAFLSYPCLAPALAHVLNHTPTFCSPSFGLVAVISINPPLSLCPLPLL